MTSKVEICNLALANIEAEALISSLDAPYENEEARYSALYYDKQRQAVLRKHPWNFATLYVTLAEIGTAPPGWTYQYQYPTDCLNAVEIVKTARTDPKIEFDIISDGASGKYILTDREDAALKYTTDITDPNVFDEMFINALAWDLALHLAGPITGSDTKKQTAATMFRNMIAIAEAADSGEGTEDAVKDASWIEARL